MTDQQTSNSTPHGNRPDCPTPRPVPTTPSTADTLIGMTNDNPQSSYAQRQRTLAPDTTGGRMQGMMGVPDAPTLSEVSRPAPAPHPVKPAQPAPAPQPDPQRKSRVQ